MWFFYVIGGNGLNFNTKSENGISGLQYDVLDSVEHDNRFRRNDDGVVRGESVIRCKLYWF